MLRYSDDSSDSGKKIIHQKEKVSPINRRKSEDVSKAHGIVVTNRSSSERSPRKRNDSKLLENSSKEQTGENYGIENSSDDEQIVRSYTAKIKAEQFLSDAESEEVIPYNPRNVDQARKYLFDNKNNEIISQDFDQSIVATYEGNNTRNSLSQGIGRKATKRSKTFIKQEILSSEEDETPSLKDSDRFITETVVIPRKNQTIKSAEQRAADNSSDTEIPPSQYWLHQYKELEKKDEKEAVKMPKKSSPVKNLNSNDTVDKKTKASIGRKAAPQRKSPPRITKTEIISTKYKRIDRQIVKNEEESYLDKISHDDEEGSEREEVVGLKVSGNNGENDEKILSKNEEFQGSKLSDGKLDFDEELLEKELSPRNKRQNQKKTQASPKRKSSSEPKIVDNNSDIEGKLKGNRNNPKLNLDNILNDKSLKARPNIYDTDSTSEKEEEERIESKKSPSNFVLALKKPKNSGMKTSNPNGTQMILVRKSDDQVHDNNETKSHSSPGKDSISHHADVKDKHSSKDSSNNVSLSPTAKKKLSAKKKSYDNDRSEETDPLVKGKAKSQKKQTINHRKSTESAQATSKRKLDSTDSSDNEEASEIRVNTSKVKLPSKMKHSESNEGNSSEIKSNKRAKLIASPKQPELEPQPEAEYAMSDSDNTDSLTKLNTTLNKSMALMINESETIKSTKSMKSVSINTKQNLTHMPNDSRTQKSILKKSEPIATNGTQEENFQPLNVPPKIIQRPLNLQNLKNQESLTYDSTKASFELEDISDDDQIYILDVPRTVDPRVLKGQTIKLGGKSKLQIGNQLYETCSKKATNISCVFQSTGKRSSYQTVNLWPAGCITLRQKLSKSSHIELSPLRKRTVPFPENLKIRHPLFGAEYKDKIVIEDQKVPKQTPRSLINEKSTVKTTETRKIEKKLMKSKNVQKHKNLKIDNSQELNDSENNFRDKVEKNRQFHSNDSKSSGSDSDESFFRKVKRENIEKPEQRKKSKNLSSISNLDEPLLTTNLPVQSVNKKLRLSLNSSALKNDSFDINTKNSEFVSSTPIKVEQDEKNYEGESLANQVGKRKTHDGVIRRTISAKKVRTH